MTAAPDLSATDPGGQVGAARESPQRPTTWPGERAPIASSVLIDALARNEDLPPNNLIDTLATLAAEQITGIYLGDAMVHNVATPTYSQTLLAAFMARNRFSGSTVDPYPKQIAAG